MKFQNKIIKGLRHPIAASNYLFQLAKGHYYKMKFRVLRKNVRIGKNFRVKKKLIIKGAGKVRIGNNVFCDGTSHAITPWTYSEKAVINIGDNIFLNGTRFGCKEKIEIGDNCIIADCRILDTDFHSIIPHRRNDPSAVRSGPIKIGKDVWIGLNSVVLRGVTIHDSSTVAACSVVYKDVPEYTVYGGNPAVFIKNVPKED